MVNPPKNRANRCYNIRRWSVTKSRNHNNGNILAVTVAWLQAQIQASPKLFLQIRYELQCQSAYALAMLLALAHPDCVSLDRESFDKWYDLVTAVVSCCSDIMVRDATFLWRLLEMGDEKFLTQLGATTGVWRYSKSMMISCLEYLMRHQMRRSAIDNNHRKFSFGLGAMGIWRYSSPHAQLFMGLGPG
jgi:hypothetical protein